MSAQIQIACDGFTAGYPFSLSSHQVDENGSGIAVTQSIQFNINMAAAVNSTVLVDFNNSPSCTVTVDGGYRITEATYDVTHNGVWTRGGGSSADHPAPEVILRYMRVEATHDNRTARFRMIKGVHTSLAGVVTLRFAVNYQPSQAT